MLAYHSAPPHPISTYARLIRHWRGKEIVLNEIGLGTALLLAVSD